MEDINTSIYNTLITGDIVLFHGNGVLSNIVEWGTMGEWSHVGIVVKDPNFCIDVAPEKGLYLLQSDGKYEVDIESGKKRLGVQLVNLKSKIDEYDGSVFVRQLQRDAYERNDEENTFRNNLLKIPYKTLFEKTYDYLPLDLLVTMLDAHGITILDGFVNGRHIDHIFCSALVAYVYCDLGIMNKDTNWSTCVPSYFAQNLDGELHFDGDVKYYVTCGVELFTKVSITPIMSDVLNEVSLNKNNGLPINKIINHDEYSVRAKMRTFSATHNDPNGNIINMGRFTGMKPKQAANKAFSAIMKHMKESGNDLEKSACFKIKETTKGDNGKEYMFIGVREKLNEPFNIEMKDGKTVLFTCVNKITKYVECENVECENVECENVECENVECENVECENVECENVECENVECENVECENVECENVECENVECENVECENVECENVETTNENNSGSL
jgi:hypothetical protein